MQSLNRRGYSHQNNRYIVVVKWLLIFGVSLMGVTSAECRKHRNTRNQYYGYEYHLNEARKKSPEHYLSSPEECYRECWTNEPPKTCYYHFTIELYPAAGEACQYCTPSRNNSITPDCQCVALNGVEKIIMAVNRMFPGPSIQVCKGDKIVVDVANEIPGSEVTIHWHGLYQKGTQYYDGVPLITQCPIGAETTFRYQFYAANEGTHFWHAHTATQKLDGITGALIVREPRSEDPNSHYYDHDSLDTQIFLNDWMKELASERFPGTINIRPGQEPDAVLINGKGQYTDPTTGNVTNTPSEEFIVKAGHRYRFRMINSWCTTCPTSFSIENHTMLVIAIDGIAIKPRRFSAINSFAGERYDFVVQFNQDPGVYRMLSRALGACADNRIQQTALVRYEGITGEPLTAEPTYDQPLPRGNLLNPLDGNCTKKRRDATCISHLESAIPPSEDFLRKPDVKFQIGFKFRTYSAAELYQPNTYNPFMVVGGGIPVIAVVNNKTFKYPPSPLLSQIKDVPSKTFCDQHNSYNNSQTYNGCTHIIHIPLNSSMEICLVDEAGIDGINHPFHLHGQSFQVLSMGTNLNPSGKKFTLEHFRRFDSKNMIRRNMKSPPAKDVIAIPTNGYVVLRFLADNPGYWLFHCHFVFHAATGMEILFHVGKEKDLPPVPPNFPTCGNWVPPIMHDGY